MKLRQVVDILGAQVLCCPEKVDEIEIPYGYACDLMSDVLAFCSPGAMLLTGLTNVQIVRTAQMLDLPAIAFVRGKVPPAETLSLAEMNGIVMLYSSGSMYESCGILYQNGLCGCVIRQMNEK